MDEERASRKRVEYAELKDGRKGVAIGEEHRFLDVDFENGKWRIRLYDLHGRTTSLTGWLTINNFEKLRTTRKAKLFRDLLGKELERVIGVIQDKKQEFLKESETVQSLSTAELVRQEQEAFCAVSIHPLIGYHESIGLTMGSILQGFKKALIFARRNVFAVDFGSFMLVNSENNRVLVRKLKSCSLDKKQAYILLNLARDVLENEEIQIPAFSSVFERVLKKIRHYYYHPDSRYYVMLACWIVGTYLFVVFDVYPILHLQGERETGKSTLMFLLRALCWNPTNPECSLREADLFRTVEGCHPTYLVDATKLPKKATDVNDMFESGYEKGGSVRRCDPVTYEPRDYPTFSPKGIATRESVSFSAKSIEIITSKVDDVIYTKRRVHLKQDPEHQEIVEEIIKAVVLGEVWRPVLDAYHQIEQTSKLNGRRFRLWQPLFAICKVFAPEHYEELWNLAEESAERAEAGDRVSEVEEAVLTILVQVEGATCVMLLKELTEKVIELVPWVSDWHIVKSAVKNLGILNRSPYPAAKGVTYQFDLAKVREKARQKAISIGENSEEHSESEKPTTCWICHKPLPSDGRNTTVEQGKTCHTECLKRCKAGRKS